MTSTSTPAPTSIADIRSISQIYKSGDLMLQNPAEAGIIFVSVILVSAFLEWALQRAANIENKYARMLVETMSQEVTIVGVLALLLMFGTSLIPAGAVDKKYILLFTWANMCMFFMAFFFVLTVLFLFAWSAHDTSQWRAFEEGKMDTEDEAKMSYRELLFKKAAEKYAEEVKSKFELTTGDVPYFELINMFNRKLLVRASNLSYRTWLWLSIIVIANLARAKATPFLRRGEETTFSNAIMFIGIIGWGTLFAFLIFFGMLQRRLRMYVNNLIQEKVPNGDFLIPLGGSKRAIEFIQIVIMSLNWYATLYVTGLGKETSELRGWRLAVIVIAFALPILTVATLLPWAVMSLTLLASLGSLTRADVDRIQRTVRGEAGGSDSDSDEDDDESDDGKTVQTKGATGTIASGSHHPSGIGQRRGSIGGRSSASNTSSRSQRLLARPPWLDADEDWDGNRTMPLGERRGNDRLQHLYYNNLDAETLGRALQSQLNANPTTYSGGAGDSPSPSRPKGNADRPGWADSDDDI